MIIVIHVTELEHFVIYLVITGAPNKNVVLN